MSPAGRASAKLTIGNELGLHMRAAAMVVRTAKEFKSKITISSDAAVADARSVLELLTLSAPKGTKLTVSAEGVDAEAAVAALGELVARNFAE